MIKRQQEGRPSGVPVVPEAIRMNEEQSRLRGAPSFVFGLTVMMLLLSGFGQRVGLAERGFWDERFAITPTNDLGGMIVYEGRTHVGNQIWDGQQLIPWVTAGQYRRFATGGDSLFALGRIPSSDGIGIVAEWKDNMWRGDMGVKVGLRYSAYPTVLLYAIEVFRGELYIGGDFNLYQNSKFVNTVAKWDGQFWVQVGEGISWSRDAIVYQFMVHQDRLFAAGYDFYPPNNNVGSCLSAWDGTNWTSIGFSDGLPVAVASSGTNLYVGGSFSVMNGVPARNIARWDGVQWHALGSGLGGTNGSSVLGLACMGEKVYAAGAFTNSNNAELPMKNIAVWDGKDWSALGGGLAMRDHFTGLGQIQLLARDGELLVSGALTNAGGIPSGGFAIWHPEPGPRLSAKLSSANRELVLEWSASLTNQILEWSGTLGGTNAWLPIEPSTVGTNRFVGGLTVTNRFFRLRAQ